MKKFFAVLFLLWPFLAFGEYVTRSNCDSVPPINNGTACLQTTTTGGRTAGHVYSRISGAWQDITGNGSVLGSGVAGEVTFWSSSSAVTSNSGFLWDNTAKTLSIKKANTACGAQQFTVLDTDFSSDITNGLNLIQCGIPAGFASIQNGAGTLFTANQGQHIDLNYADRTMQFYVAGSESGYLEIATGIPSGATKYAQYIAHLVARSDSGTGYFNPIIRYAAIDASANLVDAFELGAEGTQSTTTLSPSRFYLFDHSGAGSTVFFYEAGSLFTFQKNVSLDGNTLYGGTAAGSILNLFSTSATGTTDAINLKVGTNGGTTGLTVNHAGTLTVPSLTASRCVRTDGSQVFSSASGDCLTSSTAVTSIAKSGSTALHGDVTLTGGSNITLTQAGQDISIAGNAGTVTSIATTSPITGGTITGTGTIACATCGVTGSPLSQFAATTSAQLRGVLSDENGTGVALFDAASDANLTTPAITGTPNATGERGYDSTRGFATAYDGAAAAAISSCRIVAATRPNEQKTNNTTNDQDYTSLYQIPANFLIANRMIRILTTWQYVTDGAASTQTMYLKLGSTKVYTQAAAITPGNNATRGFAAQWLINGTAAAGSSVNVDTFGIFQSNANQVNSTTQPVLLATNGTLDIVPGMAFNTNTTGESLTLFDSLVEVCN